MAALDREACYQALFERLQASVPAVNFWTRRELTDDEIARAKFPAAVFVVWDQSAEQKNGLPPIWRLTAMLGVFVTTRSKTESPDTALNGIVRQVEDALALQKGEDDNSFTTTLGGKVHHCWITGTVDFYQGEATGTGEVRIQIEMLAA